MIHIKNLLVYFLYFFTSSSVFASQEEYDLRTQLFTGYNKEIRPTNNFDNILNVDIGLAVQNIESFDQIQETIELNVWLRKYWNNNRLSWNTSLYNISQLTVSENDVWTPDIELTNAATLPDIYTLNGGMYLYPNGNMLWSMPTVYKFSCPLQLKYFPFDTQICSMKFSSWSYDNSLLQLSPYGELSTQIDVLDSFSHSEWKLTSYSVNTFNETRLCCLNKTFNVNKYNFELERYTHYYKLNMGMTISLVIVSFIIMLVKPDNLSRTGTAVFIPLTILALQLTIAGKIPVVGYYTLMDYFFLTCFITSMLVSIESGVVYTLITSKSRLLFNVFSRLLNFETIIADYIKDLKENKIRTKIHDKDINKILNNITDINLKKDTNDILKIDSSSSSLNEFKQIENILNDENTIIRKDSYQIAMSNSKELNESNESNELNKLNQSINNTNRIEENIKTTIIETDLDEVINRLTFSNNDISEKNIDSSKKNDETTDINYIKSFETIVEKDVLKIINYDDKNLNITFKEYLIFNKITNIAIIIDNVFRIILPIIFLVIISIIFSYD